MVKSSGLQEILGEPTGEKVGSLGYRCTRIILESKKAALGVYHIKQQIEHIEILLDLKGENRLFIYLNIFY